ncbi:hypothetical protein D8Y22_02860 [Salinadaptatus halalkaliphilus]|uniref:Halobacterial output domain-containing protein n=1 Tax=Salinadaptatus halalkaliphilus TaxID=2419781 RepID=A0A4S3TPF2_9EURY|nr:HalOD1 output domain-containing protein [Salinadaptatus halalkaliphilus]THE66234.1 hypothetical protein D8Y22_02860 [Salinadaptatus halalkaliphilus]
MTDRRICESHGRAFGRHVRYDRREGESPSIAVATALAQYFDEDVTKANTRLYEYVDPEALDALFAKTYSGAERSVRSVEFTVDETTVLVRSDRIEVSPTA